MLFRSADKAGSLDAEFKRALSAIGQNWEISGLVDLDAKLIGPGCTTPSRLIVVGAKREHVDYSFAVPGQVNVIYDYDTLWTWGEALRARSFGDEATFGDDGREENRWQAPYLPASQVSEPETMSPRNLLGPVRKALAQLVQRYGLGVDELVCEKLGWTMDELAERLSAEQCDAVALGIQAIDDRAGLVNGDATGIGKGRVAAALALYGHRIGRKVIFQIGRAHV